MSHGFHSIPKPIRSIGNAAIPIVLAATGNPELAAAYVGGSSLLSGKGIGKSLLSAGETYGGSELGSYLTSGGLNGALGAGNGTGVFSSGPSFTNPLSGLFGSSSGGSGSTLDLSNGSTQDLLTQGGGGIGQGEPGAGSYNFSSAAPGIANGSTSGGSSILGSLGKSGLASLASPILSGGLSAYSQAQAVGDITNAENKNKALLTPFLNETFSPGDLTQTPGYQFSLNQANAAGDRKDAATGNYYSGAALKESQDRAAGLASQTYNDAYNQFLQTQQQKLGAAGSIAGQNDAIGSAKANAAIGTGNTLAQSGSALLGTLGGGNYYNPSTGTVYNPNNPSGGSDILAALYKKLGIGNA